MLHVGERGLPSEPMGRIRGAPARALFGRRVQIDLHVGVGKHHRADIASFDHDAAVLAGLALASHERSTHARQPRHGCGPAVDLRRANRGGDIVPVNVDDIGADVEHRALGNQGHCVFIIQASPVLQRFPRHRAIHRPGIEMPVTQPSGDGACDGAFSSAGGTVDRNDEGTHKRSR